MAFRGRTEVLSERAASERYRTTPPAMKLATSAACHVPGGRKKVIMRPQMITVSHKPIDSASHIRAMSGGCSPPEALATRRKVVE